MWLSKSHSNWPGAAVHTERWHLQTRLHLLKLVSCIVQCFLKLVFSPPPRSIPFFFDGMLNWTHNAVPFLLGTLIHRSSASGLPFYNPFSLWPFLPAYTRTLSLMPSPLHRLTATEVLGLIKDDKISVVTYVRDLLSRIEKRDSTVKAWAYLGKPLSPFLRDHMLISQ